MPESKRTIIIVSGMPRSGTSMMMQMLGAAGLPIHSDGQREPDIDNPNGYFELEAAKRLKADASFLAKACGKVVKVVAPLLPHLPATYAYRVIFMQRAIKEVLASQSAMLARAGQETAYPSLENELSRAFGQVADQVKHWLAEAPNVSTLFLEHRDVLDSPMHASLETLQFVNGVEGFERAGALGGDASKSAGRMAAVVDPALHRQRAKAESQKRAR